MLRRLDFIVIKICFILDCGCGIFSWLGIFIFFGLESQQVMARAKENSMGAGSLSQNLTTVASLQSQESQYSVLDSKPKKICCACPETKKMRDECIVEHGELACEKLIEAHRKCLRAEGFKV